MRGLRGSYLGFTFNNVHSSALGITRTYNGRFNSNIFPSGNDVSIDIPLADGKYYYGTTFKNRVFQIEFAFEGLTDYQIKRIKQLWNDKKIHSLIFDEEPYKVYSAKLTGNVVLKHLCMDNQYSGQRYYNGEGSLEFTCYFPFARSRYSYIEDYNIATIPEWIDEARESQVLTPEGIKPINGNTQAIINYQIKDETLPSTQTVDVGLITGRDLDVNFINAEIQTNDQDSVQGNGRVTAHASTKNGYINILEWKDGSKLPSRSNYGFWERIGATNQYAMLLNNTGDLEGMMSIWFRSGVSQTLDQIADFETVFTTITLNKVTRNPDQTINKSKIGEIAIKGLKPLNQKDDLICIDFYRGTIQGYYTSIVNERIPTNTLYNVYMSGLLCEIPTGEIEIVVSIDAPQGVNKVATFEQLRPEVELTYLYY